MVARERRGEERSCPGDLIGVGLSHSDQRDEHVAVVDNISADGIGITADVFLTPGSLVEIDPGTPVGDWAVLRSGRFRGEVCWCTREETSPSVFHLGIRRL